MPHDPGTTPSREWHAALAAADDDVRRAEDARTRQTAVSTLERRLDLATAELHALREAVELRNTLLREQRIALAERDDRIAHLVATHPGAVPRRSLPRRALSRARRAVAGMKARALA